MTLLNKEKKDGLLMINSPLIKTLIAQHYDMCILWQIIRNKHIGSFIAKLSMIFKIRIGW